MRTRVSVLLLVLCSLTWLATAAWASPADSASLKGVVQGEGGNRMGQATVILHSATGSQEYTATTSGTGEFSFKAVNPGNYGLSIVANGKTSNPIPVHVKDADNLPASLKLTPQGQLRMEVQAESSAPQASGGEHLSSGEVSSLPLNERDFSKLLLLAAGTMTDANGAANFTQQFAVNGQRGTATVFAIDGADTTDPEMGGATFSNFNVDAIQEVQGSSGVMPAEIGHGAASYTNVVSKSGVNQVHGSAFEFIRNAAFDARNYFDHKSVADERRIPPFVRNEFGFTNGGPVVIPGLYNGRSKTFYFGEYQGFRQVLGTTQVFPVPTAAERQGIDTFTFPGDTLTVPVNSEVLPVLAAYPLPNDPSGAYGDRTYAASSKVYTRTDQFSGRIDHHISDKATLLTRFSLNQVNGPLTNPDQTAIDPSFGIEFFDHQRNAVVKYTRAISPRLTSETSLGYIRSTPFFPANNHTQPALGFGDGLFQGFNSADGQILGSFGNLFQLRHDMGWVRGSHSFKWGTELRFNFDQTIFGLNPNGAYSFGGGTAYSPVWIKSASGTHDIQPGDPLPNSLLGLLTGTPYSYTIAAAADVTQVGDRFNAAAVRREAYNFYFQDTWKATPRLTMSYGLRYELNSRIHDAYNRTALPRFVDTDGKPTSYLNHNGKQFFVYNPQPPYDQDWNGWGPRLSLDYAVGQNTVLHAGGAITTMLVNLWQDNFLTGPTPLVTTPFISALPDVPVPFHNSVTPLSLPPVYSTDGQLAFPNGDANHVKPNTVLDLSRYERDLSALTPGHQVQLLNISGIAKNFKNGYIGSWTLGVDHSFGDIKASASYVATTGIHLTRVFSPNSYGGAEPQFAPFTEFDSSGRAIGGYGPESIISSGSHSSYHALQTSLSKNSSRLGLGFQASYTYSKSLDDTSSVLGGIFGTAGVILQTSPQNPWDTSAEKGPSTFDVTHVFTVSAIQMLNLDKMGFLHKLPKPITSGWQVLNITTLLTGSPFTVFSGVQQTGVGAGGADRPDLAEKPQFSTSRGVREDYFGRGADNRSFFSIPINVPGGTGPNQGRFGTLGRNTFRGPGFQDYDFAVIKDTPFGRRGNGELGILQFRAEFFNIFNLVNFGLPSNIVRGSGFGVISKTAGNSRQIQFSVKLVY
jgi:hypothetical protein